VTYIGAMRRRALLSLVATLSGGCLSATRSATPTDTPTPDPLPPTGDAAISEFDAGEPFETRTVGDPESGTRHRIVVWNDDADRRSIRVRLRGAGTGDAAIDAAPTFPAYGSLRVGVFRPADYVLEVHSPRDGPREFGVRGEFVDCNDSATHVAVRPDGSVLGQVVSTAAACETDSPPEVGDESDPTAP